MKYLLLSVLWITWCFLHSFFTATKTAAWFRFRLEKRFIYYRICYNLFSLFTVIPLLYWQGNIPGPVIIPLSPLLRAVKFVTIISAIIIMSGSFFSFDAGEFLGIKQLTDKKEAKGIVISRHGFYSIVRHPMYLAGVIFFLALMTDAVLAQFIGYFILAFYMIIGTIHEDRRLADELGDAYKEYQKEVPMLLPRF
ncbi:MAG: isoprenylcysteine carboxylmethyltransferase family protein [Nitrospirae bacterium]|nr:isoprenylcysteine carboxylmethyltransferase family protein [Nitrospirota bacterium]